MFVLSKTPQQDFYSALEFNLSCLSSSRKVYFGFLRGVKLRLNASSVWYYHLLNDGTLRKEMVLGNEGLCDEGLLNSFARYERPNIPHQVLISFVKVSGRPVGIAGAALRHGTFKKGEVRIIKKLCAVLSRNRENHLKKQLFLVLDRIKEKIVAELSPVDLAYQILDGLHQLVHNDHSSAFLAYSPKSNCLRIEAEKISWNKARSAYIGHEIPISDGLKDVLPFTPELMVLSDHPKAMNASEKELYNLMNYHQGNQLPKPSRILIAPLFFDTEYLGLLKIAAWQRLPFDDLDKEVVSRFLPVAAISLKNARVKSHLENRAVEAEIKASVVTLARAVAHDINNAMCSTELIIDQMNRDIADNQIDRENFKKDLEMVGTKIALCKRIFSNMLRAGHKPVGTGSVNLNTIIEEMLEGLHHFAYKLPIEIKLDLASTLPPVRVAHDHLERIVWNLFDNSKEAFGPEGGTITLKTHMRRDLVTISVVDDGPGIPKGELSKVQEPFYSTKESGTGLGLSLCRSLAWQHSGTFDIQSKPGAGTKVHLGFPPHHADPSTEPNP